LSARAVRPEDVGVFCDAAGAFFEATTGSRARVRTAFQLRDGVLAQRADFLGIIEIGGRFRGSVVFGAPRGLLSHVLLVLGSSDYSEESHRDIAGEIANQMAGYARRSFGEGLDIAVPRVLAREESWLPPPTPFVIPMTWDRYEAQLVVDLAAV
jgi:chemotaxis protein CheX